MSDYFLAWVNDCGVWVLGAIDLILIPYCLWMVYRLLVPANRTTSNRMEMSHAVKMRGHVLPEVLTMAFGRAWCGR